MLIVLFSNLSITDCTLEDTINRTDIFICSRAMENDTYF